MKKNEITLSQWLKKNKEKEMQVIRRDLSTLKTAPCLAKGVELFDIKANPEPPESIALAFGIRRTVSADKVISAISRDIGTKGYQLFISDTSYTIYSLWEVISFVVMHDDTDLITYTSQVFDCDDFAQVLQGNVNRVLKGIPFGTIWYHPASGGYHAVNIFYCYIYDKIYLVEPQNDTFYRFNKKGDQATLIII